MLLEGRAVPVVRAGEGGIEDLYLDQGGQVIADWRVPYRAMSVWS